MSDRQAVGQISAARVADFSGVLLARAVSDRPQRSGETEQTHTPIGNRDIADRALTDRR